MQLNNIKSGRYIRILPDTVNLKLIAIEHNQLNKIVNKTSCIYNSIMNDILDHDYPTKALEHIKETLGLNNDWELSEDSQNWIAVEQTIRISIPNNLIATAKNEKNNSPEMFALNSVFTSVRNERDGVDEFEGAPNPNIKILIDENYTICYVNQIRPENAIILNPYINDGAGEIKIEYKN